MPSTPSAPTIAIPIEYAGLWIAWNQVKTRIVASGRTVEDVVRSAEAAGEKEPMFEKVPKAHVRVVGGLHS